MLASASRLPAYVYTGPLFERPMRPMLRGGVLYQVPSAFWKVAATADGRYTSFLFDQNTPRPSLRWQDNPDGGAASKPAHAVSHGRHPSRQRPRRGSWLHQAASTARAARRDHDAMTSRGTSASCRAASAP